MEKQSNSKKGTKPNNSVMVKCKLENGDKKIVNIKNHKKYSSLINELQKSFNLKIFRVSYSFEGDDYQIENQTDWDTALQLLQNNITVNIKSLEADASQSAAPQKVCREFQRNGTCKYGKKCQYSHSKAQHKQESRREFEYSPFKNNNAIEAFLEKKIVEKSGPSELSTPICKLQLEDILSRANLSVDGVIKILELLVSDTIFNSVLKEDTNKLFSMLLNSKYMVRLGSFLSQELPTLEDTAPLEYAILLFRELLQRFSTAYKSIPIESLLYCVNETSVDLCDEVVEQIVHIKEFWTEQRTIDNTKFKQTKLDISYKNLPLFPSSEEFMETNNVSKLPVNLAVGKFVSGLQYLDVNYKLLREDCMRPLREGIKAIVSQQKSSDVKVYQEVRLCGLHCHPRHGIIYQISFNSKFKVNFARSKRLITGSLLCISNDNFKTLLWATVADRKPEDLEKKRISIRFPNGFEPNFKLGVVYEMAESSSAYFEAYRHVLQGLQEMDPFNIPFADYLLNAKKYIAPPKYIEKAREINFSAVFDHLPRRTWHPTRDVWPQINTTMDGSQLEAIKLALTKEVSLIQGPPGTGKTFVGLSIAKLLLSNFDSSQGPILVICFTNHALDQFLEAIYQFEPNVVRVGGRSQSEIMEERNINVLERKLAKENRDSKRIGAIRREMEEIEHKIRNCVDALNQKLTIQLLHGIAEQHQIDELTALNGKSLDSWVDRRPKKKNEEQEIAEEEIDEQFDEQEMREFEEEIKAIEQTPEEVNETIEIAIEEGADFDNDQDEDAFRQANIRNLRPDQRQILYKYWVHKYQEKLNNKIQEYCQQYESLAKTFREISSNVQLQVLQKAAVIGMTTTCAARSHDMLVALGAKIIIVEEAAEILEAHILTALTPSTEHLILIGDHLQLRPSVAVDVLGRKHNLNISLFERLINNGLDHKTLLRQRRMRPEFSNLILKLYPELQYHESVTKYENVRGMSQNLYFFHHKFKENGTNEMKSYSNDFEAEYVCRLARYLMIQGYMPENITILTTYVGQLLKIKDFAKKVGILGVRVVTVDNYQGEENQIVLLSLVRSNDNNSSGFIKTDNRACVALSRAKVGFYVVGNFEMFTTSFWKYVTDEVKRQKAFGSELSTVCQQHPDKKTIIKSLNDFNSVEDGGCNLSCTVRLPCGHVCPKRCHPDSHDDYLCQKTCNRTGHECNPPRECQHPCKQMCYKPCGPCSTQVEKRLPGCNHIDNVPCSQSLDTWKCTKPCFRQLRCGHPCTQKCGDACDKFCEVKVKRTLRGCGHQVEMKCSDDPEKFVCTIPCTALLDCEHQCPGTCGKCADSHMPCKSRCGRMLICSHECNEPCTKNCPPCSKRCENACIHSKCSRKCGDVCTPCKEPCPWRCEHIKCVLLCSDICTRVRCNESCKKKLKCGHDCIGLCGEPCPPVCRTCDPSNKIFDILFGNEDEPDAKFVLLQDCKHIFESEALDRYMDEPPSSNTIQLKKCPNPDCKKPIRKSYRYANAVKQTLQDIEQVKKQILQQQELYKKLIEQLKNIAEGHKKTVSSSKFLSQHMKTISSRLGKLLTGTEITLVQHELAYIVVLYEYQREMIPRKTESKELVEKFLQESNKLFDQAMSLSISETRFTELKLQIEKCYITTILMLLAHKHKNDATTFQQLKQLYQALEERPLTEELVKQVKLRMKELDIIVTVQEREEIVKAIGLGKGHWYKCPNGHFYAIGECGGAMETAKCTCGATIGGSQHRLVSDNQHAGEMDGSRHAAWSEANNLANFDPANFE